MPTTFELQPSGGHCHEANGTVARASHVPHASHVYPHLRSLAACLPSRRVGASPRCFAPSWTSWDVGPGAGRSHADGPELCRD